MQNEQHERNGNTWTGPNDLPPKIELHQPSLKELKNVLTNALMINFEDVVVNITRCPDLTIKPFNLAAKGLCGNTAIIQCYNPMPYLHLLSTRKIWNMLHFLKNFAYDSFLIGGGFSSKPELPSNGYLCMNATFSQPDRVNNTSYLTFAKGMIGGRIMILKEPNQMVCSIIGNFFMSEGRPGPVLEVRAKKCKCDDFDFIKIIENALTSYYYSKNKVVGLGGILLINKGKVSISVIPNYIPQNQIHSLDNLTNWIQYRDINCSDMVAFGTIISRSTVFEKQNFCHRFYTFSEENKIGGHFFKDLTPDETEYVGYFSLAKDFYAPAPNVKIYPWENYN